MEPAVLYEDDWLIAFDKPAGVVVHPAYKNPDRTLLDAVRSRGGWLPGQRPSIIGRLDKLTSGLVVFAKTADAHAGLQRTMASPNTDKEYLAVVYGNVDVEQGEIDVRLALDPKDRRVVLASATTGASAVTRFERLARVAAPAVGLGLLRCRLVTGRRHQIRVHLASRGWPIVGDPAYGQPRWVDIEDAALAAALRDFPRQALHAHRLAFAHPWTQQRVVITAPLPRDLLELIESTGLTLR